MYASGPPYLAVFIFSVHTTMGTAEFCGYKKDSSFSFMGSQTGEKKKLRSVRHVQYLDNRPATPAHPSLS